MSNLEKFKKLAVCVATGKVPSEFEKENTTPEEVIRNFYKQEINGSLSMFNKYKYDLFEIIQVAADEVKIPEVIRLLGSFAEVRYVEQNQKITWRKPLGERRARTFLTQAALAGVYETFRLDSEGFTVGVHAIGGAARIDFERFLDGAESLVQLMNIITKGLVDAIYVEVHKALVAAISTHTHKLTNTYEDASFDAQEMLRIIGVVKKYGDPVIFATDEFIQAMGPDAIVPAMTGAAQGIYSPDDIESIHNTGRIKIFRGVPIVEIMQSFVDDTNTKTWINPQFAYVLPSTGEKVVKVVIEGKTQMYDYTNRDQSMDINTYQKVGVGIITYQNWGIYKNTGITDTSYNPYTNI